MVWNFPVKSQFDIPFQKQMMLVRQFFLIVWIAAQNFVLRFYLNFKLTLNYILNSMRFLHLQNFSNNYAKFSFLFFYNYFSIHLIFQILRLNFYNFSFPHLIFQILRIKINYHFLMTYKNLIHYLALYFYSF